MHIGLLIEDCDLVALGQRREDASAAEREILADSEGAEPQREPKRFPTLPLHLRLLRQLPAPGIDPKGQDGSTQPCGFSRRVETRRSVDILDEYIPPPCFKIHCELAVG